MFRSFLTLTFCLFASYAFAGGPAKPGLCCLQNYPEQPLSQDPDFVGLWHVSIDWSQLHKVGSGNSSYAPEKRDWILNADGTCYDTKGGFCIWGADKGIIAINFLTAPIYFRGSYDPAAKIKLITNARIYNSNCDEGIVIPIQADKNEEIPPSLPIPDEPPKIKDDFGSSKPRQMDEALIKLRDFELHWDWSCNNKGTKDVIRFFPNGRCGLLSSRTDAVPCQWAAADGKIRIDFADGRHLKGHYDAKTGLITNAVTINADCEEGCAHTTPFTPIPPHKPLPPTSLPVPSTTLPPISSPTIYLPSYYPPFVPPVMNPPCQQYTSGCS